jgi:hypothetical protein
LLSLQLLYDHLHFQLPNPDHSSASPRNNSSTCNNMLRNRKCTLILAAALLLLAQTPAAQARIDR